MKTYKVHYQHGPTIVIALVSATNKRQAANMAKSYARIKQTQGLDLRFIKVE